MWGILEIILGIILETPMRNVINSNNRKKILGEYI